MRNMFLGLGVLLLVGCSSLTVEEEITKEHLESCLDAESSVIGFGYEHIVSSEDGFMGICSIKFVALNGHLSPKKAKIILTRDYEIVNSKLDEFIALVRVDIDSINNGSKYFDSVESFSAYKERIAKMIYTYAIPLHLSGDIATHFDMREELAIFHKKSTLLADETKKLVLTWQSSEKIFQNLKKNLVSTIPIKNAKFKDSFAELIVRKELEFENTASLYGFDSVNNVVNNALVNAKNLDDKYVTLLSDPKVIGASKFIIKVVSGKTGIKKEIVSQEELESEKVVRVTKVKNQNYVILQQALRNAEQRKSMASTRTWTSLIANATDMALYGPQDAATTINNSLIQAENNSAEALASMSVEQLQADLNNTPEFLFDLKTRQYVYDKNVVQLNRASNYYIEIYDVVKGLTFRSDTFVVKDEKKIDVLQGFSCDDMIFYDESTGVKKECTVERDKNNLGAYLKSPAIGIDWKEAFIEEIPKLTFSEVSYQ